VALIQTLAMPKDLDPARAERRSISTVVIDSLVLYACSQYPTAGSIEMMSRIQEGHAVQAARRDGSRGEEVSSFRRNLPTPRRSPSMHQGIQQVLRVPAVTLTARIALTFPFWSSGLMKLFDFEAGAAEMARFGLIPAGAFNTATILVQLIGSLLIIANRLAWLGAGALGVFTALTVFLVHRFWAITEEPFRTIAFHTATEHVGIIGGLVAISILAADSKPRTA